jgi:hypothetical protein
MNFNNAPCCSRSFQSQGILLKTDVCNPDQGSIAIRDQGKQQFFDFVQSTYEGLYAIESSVIGGKPSMSVFCRMDISLIVDSQTNHVCYFVNEVERYHTTSLWSNMKQGAKSVRAPLGSFADTFSDVFYKYLVDIKNPYLYL